jgi:methionyl-tRNA synthetase
MTTLLTTSLPYVNAAPHLGHALELVQGDVLARPRRLSGEALAFASGTDDNSLKNVRAAEARGVPVADFVVETSASFVALASRLGVHFDHFVHTGRDAEHTARVHALWQRLAERGDLYRSAYRGLYCVGCEQFYVESELDAGLCREHGTPPEVVEEENWFFRLSRHAEALERIIEADALLIRPLSRKNEVLRFIRGGLADFSVSRSVARARGWGVPVPGDPAQVVFVWLDALCGYLAGWADRERRTHLIGKGILRFHAVYWPALLLSAGLPLPDEVLVHGYVTVDRKKIGKSLGNGICPVALLDAHGEDAVRWYLLRHIHTTEDSDVAVERIVAAHDADLADPIGNLVSRVIALAKGSVPEPREPGPLENELREVALAARRDHERGFDEFAFHDAARAVLDLAAATNRYLERTEPWRLARDPARAREHATALYSALEAIRFVSVLLAPLLPDASRRIRERLGLPPVASLTAEARWGLTTTDPLLRSGPPLFPKQRAR